MLSFWNFGPKGRAEGGAVIANFKVNYCMKIFLSWSGEVSHSAALALKRFLKRVIQASEPYVSSIDIDKGARWFDDVSEQLDDSQYGILCITKDNLTSNWIHFEAGALAKNVSRGKVTPLLIGVSPTDVVPPLSQFQMTRLVKDDVFQLIEQINQASVKLPSGDLKETFDAWWPRLEEDMRLVEVREHNHEPEKIERTDRELLEELLALTRSNIRVTSDFYPTQLRSDGNPTNADLSDIVVLTKISDNQPISLPDLMQSLRATSNTVIDSINRLLAGQYIFFAQNEDSRNLLWLTPKGESYYRFISGKSLGEDRILP